MTNTDTIIDEYDEEDQVEQEEEEEITPAELIEKLEQVVTIFINIRFSIVHNH